MRFFLLKNKAIDTIWKPNAIESILTSNLALFSFNAPCFWQNRSVAAICRFDAVEAIYSNTLVFLFTQLLSVLEDKYVEPSILGDKKSLICIIIELFRKEDKTNLRIKRTKLKQDIYLLKQVKRL